MCVDVPSTLFVAVFRSLMRPFFPPTWESADSVFNLDSFGSCVHPFGADSGSGDALLHFDAEIYTFHDPKGAGKIIDLSVRPSLPTRLSIA